MSHTTVRAHTRRGYQVREHSRQVAGRVVADVLARDLDRVHEQPYQDGTTEGIRSANPDCPHPGWYPVRRLLIDTPYEDSPILAYCCTGCAASRLGGEARERVLAEGE